jgi:hypothetical protein
MAVARGSAVTLVVLPPSRVVCAEKSSGDSGGEEIGGAWGRETSSAVAFDALMPARCRLRAFAGELLLAAPSTEKSPPERAARAAECCHSCGQGRTRLARTCGRFSSLRAAVEVLPGCGDGAPARARRRISCTSSAPRPNAPGSAASSSPFPSSGILPSKTSSTWLRPGRCGGGCRGKQRIGERKKNISF